MRIVTNSETGDKKYFRTDKEFLEYVRKVYAENEDGQPYPSEIHWLPDNVRQATEYIVEYCGELELDESLPMSLQEIKAAVDAGKIVHWANPGYTVVKDKHNNYCILCTSNKYATGLTWADGVTWDYGDGADFFLGPETADAKPMYTVVLTSCGNPDYRQDPYKPISPTSHVPCSTMKECSELCMSYIEEHDLGCGNWAGGEVFDLQHKLVALVSYNGRVLDPNGKEILI